MIAGALIAAAAVLLFALGLVAPRRSRKVQGRLDGAFGAASAYAAKAPGRLGKWLAKSVRGSRKATSKSSRAGRKSRFKLPF